MTAISTTEVLVTYSLKLGGQWTDMGVMQQSLATDLASIDSGATSASTAHTVTIYVDGSSENYTFTDDFVTKLFYSLKGS